MLGASARWFFLEEKKAKVWGVAQGQPEWLLGHDLRYRNMKCTSCYVCGWKGLMLLCSLCSPEPQCGHSRIVINPTLSFSLRMIWVLDGFAVQFGCSNPLLQKCAETTSLFLSLKGRHSEHFISFSPFTLMLYVGERW